MNLIGLDPVNTLNGPRCYGKALDRQSQQHPDPYASPVAGTRASFASMWQMYQIKAEYANMEPDSLDHHGVSIA